MEESSESMAPFFSFLTGSKKEIESKEKDSNGERVNNKAVRKEFFTALIPPLIPDSKDGITESRTITIRNANDAQIIITNISDNESLEDAFDKVQHFLGDRFDPASAGVDILALDPLIERIFIRKTKNEAIEYPVFDTSGKPALTAVLKNPLMLVVRKGLRTVAADIVQNDRIYIPISLNMSRERIDMLINELYRHKAVKLYTRLGVQKDIGINPDIALINAVIPHLIPGCPSYSSLEWQMASKNGNAGETIYVWLEVTDRKYYNKLLTQIYEIICNFYASELEKHRPEEKDEMFAIQIQTAVFVTTSGIGGEICSLIPLIGSGFIFSREKIVFSSGDNYVDMNMKTIGSMGIELKNNMDV